MPADPHKADMNRTTSEPGPRAEPVDASATRGGDGATSVLERMLAYPRPSRAGAMLETEVASWSETAGTLIDGRPVHLGASCLLRPMAGDRVVVWSNEEGKRWIVSVLDRPGQALPAVLAAPGPLTVLAPRVGLSAEMVHIHAQDFVTSTRNRHAVEHTRTETVRTRVAQVGTDIRRANHASDEVEGTILQRAGTWISNTVREARLHARAFLFD